LQIKKLYIYKPILSAMEAKKSKDADIEQMRKPILLIGLLFVGSMVLAAFSYTSAIDDGLKGDAGQRTGAVKYEQEVKKEDDTPPPPPPQVDAPAPIQEDIKEEENKETIPVPVVETPPPVPVAETTIVSFEEEIIDFPDVEAGFPGGPAEMIKFINSNIQYPQTSIEMNEQGRVYLSFVVEPDGTISNIAVERGVSGDLDREAKRVVRQMPKWVPGEAKGKKVRTRCRLPINFTLN
jgi:periplasmic protein TonB